MERHELEELSAANFGRPTRLAADALRFAPRAAEAGVSPLFAYYQ